MFLGHMAVGLSGKRLVAGVLSHWVLDVIAHRPDVPVLFNGPYLGLGLWYSVPPTRAVELSLFGAGLWLYLRSETAGARRVSFWLLIAFMVVTYFAAAFGPRPQTSKRSRFQRLRCGLLCRGRHGPTGSPEHRYHRKVQDTSGTRDGAVFEDALTTFESLTTGDALTTND